jgi:uncharacterized protein involved in type VI secretion and phage assembly
MNCEQRRYFGKYRGIVVNTLDPERLARLQATVPDVLGTASSTWAMPSLPFASTHAGVVAVPPVGAGVWIEFEQGDPDYPIWSGCWWGSASEVPALVLSGQPGVGQITLVTPGQHTLVISDLPGIAGGITVRTSDGTRISLNDNAIALDNGKGAAISLIGNAVKIRGGQIVIDTGKGASVRLLGNTVTITGLIT